jgi:processing peptidase subunit beta
LTEGQTFRGNIDMGILLDVGTRDEDNETSGSLLSIQNTYLKTVLNTNETVNYGVI